jgi:hypothetical protein
LPTIEGNVDYFALRGQLTTMDELLRSIGLENDFVGSAYRMSIGEIPRLLA